MNVNKLKLTIKTYSIKRSVYCLHSAVRNVAYTVLFVVLALFSNTLGQILKAASVRLKCRHTAFIVEHFTSTSAELCCICNLFYISIYISSGLFHLWKICPIKTVDSEVCELSMLTVWGIVSGKKWRCWVSWMLFFNVMSTTNKIPLKSLKQMPQIAAQKTKTICRYHWFVIWVKWLFNTDSTVCTQQQWLQLFTVFSYLTWLLVTLFYFITQILVCIIGYCIMLICSLLDLCLVYSH